MSAGPKALLEQRNGPCTNLPIPVDWASVVRWRFSFVSPPMRKEETHLQSVRELLT